MLNLLTLRALKGAPLSIIIAMFFAQQPVGEGWLVSVTGYSQNTVRNGCKFLITSELIRRNGRYDSYVLVNGAVQLPLTIDPEGEGQNLTLPPVTTTTAFNRYEEEVSEEIQAEAVPGASKNDSRLVLLYSAGVREPTASSLLEHAWVTRDYLEAHIDKANREGTAVGLLIHRIRSHDPIPKEWTKYSVDAFRECWIRKD